MTREREVTPDGTVRPARGDFLMICTRHIYTFLGRPSQRVDRFRVVKVRSVNRRGDVAAILAGGRPEPMPSVVGRWLILAEGVDGTAMTAALDQRNHEPFDSFEAAARFVDSYRIAVAAP